MASSKQQAPGKHAEISSNAPGAHSKNKGGQTQDTNYDSGLDGGGYGGGYGYGGYGGGGGGSTGPTPEQEKAGDNLRAISAAQAGNLLAKQKNADKVYKINDAGSKNSMNFQAATAEKAAGAEWFSNLLKEQAVYKAQRDKMGNARYGSGALDLNQSMERAHDATAVGIIETLENNLAQIDAEYYQALQNTINGRNELAMDTAYNLRQGEIDTATQLNNIHPDLAEGIIDTEKHDVNGDKIEGLPDYSFKDHLLPAQRYTRRGLTRPDAATKKAYTTGANGVKPGLGQQNTSSSANQRYWDALTTTYGQRRV